MATAISGFKASKWFLGDPMEFLYVILFFIIVVLLAALAWALITIRRIPEYAESFAKIVDTLRIEFTNILQHSSSDLTERIIKSSTDMRQDISDRLQTGQQHIQERIEHQLTENRKELQSVLQRTTQILENKFSDLESRTIKQLETIREKVDIKLGEIGQQVQKKLNENIKEGFKHFEKVQEHLKQAELQLKNVQEIGSSVNELNNLLKLPHLRGGFGEATLERLLADFLPATTYKLQASLFPGAQERVDAVVDFPGTRLPIDSKFPREQILPLFNASEPNKLSEARKKLSQVIKTEAKRIARYVRPDQGTSDMALMFLPSETLYFEVIRDVSLWEEIAKLKIFPVSPNTLAITLKGIAISYEYYRMAKNVEKTISEIRKAQFHYTNFQKRFNEVGKEIDRAKQAFQMATTHLDRYSGSVVRLTGEATPALEDGEPSAISQEEESKV
jgi:DNA recombination protein RmuC